MVLTAGSGHDDRLDKRAPFTGEAGSLLVSGTEFGLYEEAIVLTLTFDLATNAWLGASQVFFKAIDDLAIEGERNVMINHMVDSADATLDGAAVRNVAVAVRDNDIGSAIFDETANGTLVLEGVEGAGAITDTYDVRLAVAPTAEVTVNLAHNTEIELYDAGGVLITELTFTVGNYAVAQTVTVKAVDDSDAENPESVKITHTFTSADTNYSEADAAELIVRVLDDDTAGVLVIESDGNTLITDDLSAPATDTYTLRLLSRPGENVTVTGFSDGQTLLSAGGAGPAAPTVDLVFTTGNWFNEQTVTVERDPAFVAPEGSEAELAPELGAHRLNTIAGPLVIEGGVAEGRDRSLRPAVMLPHESTALPNETVSDLDETTSTDTLNVFNDNSVADDVGVLDSTSLDNELVTLGDPTNLSGLGMSGPVTFDVSIEGEDPRFVTFEGGITFDDIEITEIMLGVGNDEFIVRDTSHGTPGAGARLITAIHGGGNSLFEVNNDLLFVAGVVNTVTRGDGGNWVDSGFAADDFVKIEGTTSNDGIFEIATAIGDTLTLVGTLAAEAIRGTVTLWDTVADEAVVGGDTITILVATGPLVVYGDTSQDGSRYDSVPSVAGLTGNAVVFDRAGNDVIDASAWSSISSVPDGNGGTIDFSGGITIYGGGRNDTIWGSQAGDHIAGGSGDDVIHGQGGDDHIYGDSGFNVDLTDVAFGMTVTDLDASTALSRDQMVAGEDEIHGDSGTDIIFGDHGVIDQTPGTERIRTTAEVIQISSSQPGNGADDVIFGNDARDFILGGTGSDTIEGNAGADVIFGDHGTIVKLATGELINVSSHTPDVGGVDTIDGHLGDDLIIGGAAGDFIGGDEGADRIFGDSGEMLFTMAGVMTRMASTATAIGGVDIITGDDGNDLIIGGAAGDTIAGNAGEDRIFGDSGEMLFTAAGVMTRMTSTTTDVGGVDIITGDDANDLIIGGAAGDTIEGNGGEDRIFGDSGNMLFTDVGVMTLMESITTDVGGIDTIRVVTPMPTSSWAARRATSSRVTAARTASLVTAVRCCSPLTTS